MHEGVLIRVCIVLLRNNSNFFAFTRMMVVCYTQYRAEATI